MTSDPQATAQPYPIVCLECQGSYLYAEMVQMAEPPQRCWLRPLWLKVAEAVNATDDYTAMSPLERVSQLYDLQGSPDLLWPCSAIRPALDTEILPLLMTPPAASPLSDCGNELSMESPPTSMARQQLHSFLHQLWCEQ